MEEPFDIPLSQEIEQVEPLYSNVECQDRELRDTGGVRIPPNVLEELEADYPDDVLPTDVPAIEGIAPFGLNEADQCTVYESVDFTEGHRLHGKLWTAILTKNLEITFGDSRRVDYQPSGVLIGSFPELYDVNKMSVYCPDLNVAILERLDTEHSEYMVYDLSKESLVRSLDFNELDFYDVPDEILLELLPEEYNPDIVSNNI